MQKIKYKIFWKASCGMEWSNQIAEPILMPMCYFTFQTADTVSKMRLYLPQWRSRSLIQRPNSPGHHPAWKAGLKWSEMMIWQLTLCIHTLYVCVCVVCSVDLPFSTWVVVCCQGVKVLNPPLHSRQSCFVILISEQTSGRSANKHTSKRAWNTHTHLF